MSKRLLLFDFDGVLVDSYSYYSSRLFEIFRHFRLDQLCEKENFLRLFDSNIVDGFRSAGIPEPTVQSLLREFADRLHEDDGDYAFFDGIPEVLERLAKSNVVCIISSNLTRNIEAFLRRHRIACVDEILGLEKEASKTLKIQSMVARHLAMECFYIGDTKGDMIEGRKAGVRVVAVGWGWHAAERLAEAHPDHAVQTPRQLLELLA
jgi:phosphoglycolate phosphatase